MSDTLQPLGAHVIIKVAVGDRMLLPKYTGTDIRLDDEDYLIIEAGDLLAIIKNG